MELFRDLYQFIGRLKSKTVVFAERRKYPFPPICLLLFIFILKIKSLYIHTYIYISVPLYYFLTQASACRSLESQGRPDSSTSIHSLHYIGFSTRDSWQSSAELGYIPVLL
jgi:hypothetical protein